MEQDLRPKASTENIIENKEENLVPSVPKGLSELLEEAKKLTNSDPDLQ